jgi:purine-nucleoside phosphorylase
MSSPSINPAWDQICLARPILGVVLGSGLGAVVDGFEVLAEVPFAAVPGALPPTVPGHAGRFLLARHEGESVLFAQGRNHLYEGLTAREVTMQVRLLHQAGVRTLVLTNAAGAVNHGFEPGQLMLIADHLNLTGTSPLLGGPHFIDMGEVYSPRLRGHLLNEGTSFGHTLVEGVYAGLLGPQYETPAEVRMLRTLGADAVGMSTVLEAIEARALGMEVLGISTLTNWAAGIKSETLCHHDVMSVGLSSAEHLRALLKGVCRVMRGVAKPS